MKTPSTPERSIARRFGFSGVAFGLMAIAAVASVGVALFGPRLKPNEFVFRARIEDCELVTPQLATAFRLTDQLLVSAGHPYEAIAGLELIDADGNVHAADVVAMRLEKDLAVLRLRQPVEGQAAVLGLREPKRFAKIQVPNFDPDHVLGMEKGRVLRRTEVTFNGENARRALEISGEIVSGDSGAPVLAGGEVVGVVFARQRVSDAGWAVSLPEIVDLLRDSSGITEPLPAACEPR